MISAEQYRPDIDGLRALSVALVVAFHAFPSRVPGGFIGVDVFFVISGYLITGIIARRIADHSFTFREFYRRRIRRIFPSLITVLLAVIAIGSMTLFPLAYERLGLHTVAGGLFFPNLLLQSEVGYFDPAAETKPLLHLWSLGVEEQFYLFWPALLLIGKSSRRSMMTLVLVITLISFAFGASTVFSDRALAFYSPLSRLWELGAGGVLALAPRPRRERKPVALAGLCLIAAAAFVLSRSDTFPGALALLPVVGALLFIAARSCLLTWSPIVQLGLISYPLYLWHWPLLSFAHIQGYETVWLRCALVILATVLAWLTYTWVERPIRAQTSIFGVREVLAGMAFVVGIGVVVYVGKGLDFRFPAEIRPVLALERYQPGEDAGWPACWLASDEPFSHFGHDCFIGSIAIWGDSHAARLYAGMAHGTGKIAQFTRDGCPPMILRGPSVCAESNVQILKTLTELKPEKVFLYAAWFNTWADWNEKWEYENQFKSLLRTLRDAGVGETVVLGPAPVWKPELPKLVYQHLRESEELPDKLAPAPLTYEQADATLRTIAENEGAHFTSIFQALCSGRTCTTHTANGESDLLTWDYGHFTTNGARFVLKRIGACDRC